MQRILVLALASLAASCQAPYEIIDCPDGSKDVVWNNLSEMFPVYAVELSSEYSTTLKLLERIEADGTANQKEKVVLLRDQLSTEYADLETKLKAAYLARRPCDDNEEYWEAFHEIASMTRELHSRLPSRDPENPTRAMPLSDADAYLRSLQQMLAD